MPLDLSHLERGDVIEVHWADIYTDHNGDPSEGDVVTRPSNGYFWETKVSPEVGFEVLVITNTLDQDLVGQNGYTAIPTCVITQVKMIRKKNRRRKAKKVEVPKVLEVLNEQPGA